MDNQTIDRLTDMHIGMPHVLKNILENLEIQDLCNMREVSTKMCEAVDETNLWKDWIKFQQKLESLMMNVMHADSLHVAAMYNSRKIFRHLLLHREDKNPDIGMGLTPLHLAASYGFADLCLEILHALDTSGGRDKLNPMSDEGETPFHIAAFRGHAEVCKVFMKDNRIFNKLPVDYDGDTPLHNAVWAKSLECVKIIVEGLEELGWLQWGQWPLNLQNKTPLNVHDDIPDDIKQYLESKKLP